MDFEFIDIKAKKQSNGLWGMPLSVLSINEVSKKYQVLQSAIIIGISECFPDACISIDSYFIDQDIGFMLKFDRNVYKDNRVFQNRIIRYENYHLEGNRLHYFYSDDERKAFFLNKKIKKIKKIND